MNPTWLVGLTVLVLLLVIIFQEWQAIERRKAWDVERKDLLDRIMAGNYATYMQGVVVNRQMDKPSEREPEQGIAI